MNRKSKNIISVLVIISVTVLSFFTMSTAKNSVQSEQNSNNASEMGMPHEMSNEGSMTNGEKGTPPLKPNDSNVEEQSEPPSKPEGEDSSNNQIDKKESSNQKQSNNQENKTEKIEKVYYVIFAEEACAISVLLVYLIMSNFNKKTIKETLDNVTKAIIYIVIVAFLTVGITILQIYYTNNVLIDNSNNQTQNSNMQLPEKGMNFNSVNVNYTATINLTNNTIINNDSTGNFLRVQKDSWGKSGANGGNVTVKMTNQKAIGNIVIDSISTLDMTINNGSYYEGTINGENQAKNISLKLDTSSKIKLTGDSYVTSLDDEDIYYSNIDFNGYTLYVNGKAIN